MKVLLSREDYAKLANIKPSTVRKWIREGSITTYYVGRTPLIDVTDAMKSAHVVQSYPETVSTASG